MNLILAGDASRTGLAACLVGMCLWPAVGASQTPTATAPEAPHAVEASVSHSLAKGITLKIATFTTGLGIYGVGTGSLFGGGLLSGINAIGSYVIYVSNEYLWDYYSPNTNISTNNESFGKATSFSRNTFKYLTFKPVVAALNWGTIYWYTGSLAATAATGTIATLALPAMFYVNNTLWDWYDWHYAPPAVAAAPTK